MSLASQPDKIHDGVSEPTIGEHKHALLAWGSLVLAAAESLCVAAVGLSGLRVAIGMSSLLIAGGYGPATGFHASAIRIPLLSIAGAGALLNLLLLWNEQRLRRRPSAAWRMRPLTPIQRRRRTIQLVTSVIALLLIAAEVVTHPWFHHEM
jgi:hypothetical protein